MFRLHETTRRRVCRTAFVLSCALPTLATLTWIAYWHRPWRAADAQARLSGTLRADVQLADWREPRPDAVRTSRVAVGAEDLRTTALEAFNVDARRLPSHEAVSVGQATVDAESLGSLVAQAAGWLAAVDQPAIQVTVRELAIEHRRYGQRFVLQDVQLRAERGEGGVWTVKAIAHAVGNDGAPRAISVEQLVVDSRVAKGATINASEAELPAWLLAAAAPMLERLGPNVTFQGSLQLELVDGVPQGVARGELRRLALAAMLPLGSPHQAEGLTSATISELRWKGQHAERLTGSLRGEALRVNQGLLEAATKQLFCGLIGLGTGKTADPSSVVAIDALACRFDFDRSGLTLWGNLPSAPNLPPGCMATSGGGPLLIQPPYTQLPAGYWVQFLAGPSGNSMPATQEAIGVARQLPLPSAAVGVK